MSENKGNSFLKNLIFFSIFWYLVFNFFSYSNTTASVDNISDLSLIQEYKNNLNTIDFVSFEKEVDLKCYRLEPWFDKDGQKFYDVYYRVQGYDVNSNIKLEGVRNEFVITIPAEKVEIEKLVDKECVYKGIISIICLKPDDFEKMNEEEKESFFENSIELGRWFYNIYAIDFIFDEYFYGSETESKQNIENGIHEMLRAIEEKGN